MTTINLLRKERPFLFLKTFFVPILLLAILLISVIVQTVYAKGGSKVFNDPKKPQIIFLIHGLLGDPTTFVDLEELLRKEYTSKQNIRVKTLYYPSIPGEGDTASINNFDPYDFARIINTQIINYMIEEGLKDKAAGARYPIELDTPISFVVHSQGGAVVMRYLNSCDTKITENRKRCLYDDGVELMEKAGWFDDRRPKWLDVVMPNLKKELLSHSLLKQVLPPANIRTFVSLASPFWGSAAANTLIWANSNPTLINLSEWAKKAPKKILGDGPDLISSLNLPAGQIKQLGMGSATVAWSRSLMLDRYASCPEKISSNMTPREILERNLNCEKNEWSESLPWTARYPRSLRVYNVAGVISEEKEELSLKGKLTNGLLSPIKFESDVVVGAPEARLDFLYYVENRFGGKPLSGRTHLAQAYYPTPSAHLPHLNAYGITSPAIATITKQDYQNHLGWALLKRVFDYEFGFAANAELSQAEKEKYLVKHLRNFTVDIKLITPTTYHRPFGVKERLVKIVPQNKDAFDEIRFGNGLGLNGFHYLRTSGQNHDGVKAKDNYYQTYYHVGRFNKEYAYLPREENLDQSIRRQGGTHKLNYTIDVLGFETKTLSLDVFPSLNSYAEIYLTPYTPIVPSEIKDKLGNTILTRIDGDEKNDILLVMDQSNKIQRYRYPKNEFKKFPACKVALLGQPSPLGHKGVNDFNGYKSYALNMGRVQKSFESSWEGVDPMLEGYAKEKKQELSFGAPLEILARYTSGKFDKYLVTSPIIREYDGTQNFKDIGKLGGFRWVNVTDVDVLKTVQVQILDKGTITTSWGSPSPSADTCLRDSSMMSYAPMRDLYYDN